MHLGLGLPCTSESPNRRRAPGDVERERGEGDVEESGQSCEKYCMSMLMFREILYEWMFREASEPQLQKVTLHFFTFVAWSKVEVC